MKDFVKCGNVALLMILVLNLMFPRGAFADGRSSGQNGPGAFIESDPAVEEFLLKQQLISEKLFGPDHPVQAAYVFDEAIMNEGTYAGETGAGAPFFIEVFYVESLMPAVPMLPFALGTGGGMVSEIHARFWSEGNYVDVIGLCGITRIDDVSFPSGVASVIIPLIDFEDLQLGAQRMGISLPPFEHFDPDCPDEIWEQMLYPDNPAGVVPCPVMICPVAHICGFTVGWNLGCDPEIKGNRDKIKSKMALLKSRLINKLPWAFLQSLGLFLTCIVVCTKTLGLGCWGCVLALIGLIGYRLNQIDSYLKDLQILLEGALEFEQKQMEEACRTGRYADNPDQVDPSEFPECCQELWASAHPTPEGAEPSDPGVCPEP